MSALFDEQLRGKDLLRFIDLQHAHLKTVEANQRGHPLAGLSSRHRLSRGEEFSFPPLLSNSSKFDRLNYAPLFSVGRCRTLGPHQSPIRFKALGDFSTREFLPAPGNVVAPENCRYHAVSKV
jgi:hypothetical protein